MELVSRKSYRRNQWGFTFLELLIVMTILGIFLSFTVMKIDHIVDKHRLNNSAKEILSHLRLAQQMAIAENKNVKIAFRNYLNTYANSYSIQINKDNKYTTLETIYLEKNIRIKYAGFNRSSSLIFSKLGYPVYSGHVLLENKQKHSLYIIVYKTGRFRISETPP